MNSNWTPSSGSDDRRRSQRVMLSLPVTISGQTVQGPFTEQTHTMVVNAHGALVGLKANVAKGQILRIKSATFPEELECHVIWVGPAAEGKNQCGLEFTKPVPKFWGVTFPPADWSPSTGVLAESKKK
jgi:hypothetical protein